MPTPYQEFVAVSKVRAAVVSVELSRAADLMSAGTRASSREASDLADDLSTTLDELLDSEWEAGVA